MPQSSAAVSPGDFERPGLVRQALGPAWEEDDIQFWGGFAAGIALGYVPFGGIGEQVASHAGAISRGTREAQIGKALGEMAGGMLLTMGGIGGEVLGGLFTTTGIGAAIGVPAMAVSVGLVAAGMGNMAGGIWGLGQAWSMGSGGGSAGAPQDKILTKGEIRKLEDAGFDVHAEKGGKHTGWIDLYKRPDGEIVIKTKGGAGDGESTGWNINDLE
jgi:hypothetical protein